MTLKDLRNKLSKFRPEEILFVGMGNLYRTDDAAGLYFIRLLKDMTEYTYSQFINAGTNPENYLQQILLTEAKAVVFIDSALLGTEPGDIAWLTQDQIDTVGIISHGFALKLIQKFVLSESEKIFLYMGIQPYSTTRGDKMSLIVSQKIKYFFYGY